nr:MAG TPA: hypothetical protein [Caudoviricetes sp.]
MNRSTICAMMNLVSKNKQPRLDLQKIVGLDTLQD